MLEIEDLTFAYSEHRPLFKRFSLSVNRGDACSVIGPSGCGKTTLLYLLAGLRHPTAGAIRIDGVPVSGPRPRSGLVLQDHGLLPWSTVRQNARLGLTIREFYGADDRHTLAGEQLDKDQTDQQVDYWLDKLRIGNLSGQYPSKLSRGERQRTAIARTLVMNPDLLLLDEPFSALDAFAREDLENVILDLHRELKLTCVIVTHDIEVAVVMGKKILVLREGCNQNPHMIENDRAAVAGYRNQPEFRSKCEEIRKLLGALK